MSQEEHNKKLQRIVLQLNKNGLASMSNQQQTSAFQYFKQAQKIVTAECKINSSNNKFQQLLAVTYNNLAIYYKKTNKPKSALTYLKNALEIQALKLINWKATASTHLNISAIYSYMKKHQQAIDHIHLANEMTQKLKEDYDKGDKKNSQDQKVYQSLKLISCYNLAVEYENLKKYQQSLQYYTRAIELSKKVSKKNIETEAQQGKNRVGETIKKNHKKLMQLLQKKKQNQEKGHYQSMVKNKKNIKTSGESSMLHLKFKKYDVYTDSKHGTISIDRFKKLSPINHQSTKNKSKDDRYKIISLKGEGGESLQALS